MFSVDIGNAYTVVYNGKQLYTLQSTITDVTSVTNYRQGDGKISYQGNLYHVGESALKYPKFRLQAERDKQVASNHLDSLLLALVGLTPIKGSLPDETHIVIQVPSTLTSYQHELVKLFNGVHSWSLDGKSYTTRLVVNSVYQEGYGSWYVAKRAKMLPQVGYTLVLDIGGGTSIVSMIDNQSGEVMPNVSTYGARGVIDLVNMLRGDLDLRLDNYNDIPSVHQLFSAIENKTYRIGHTGANIKDYVNIYVPQWWKALFQETVVNDFKPFFVRREITKVLVTGGGAEVVRPLIEAAQQKPGDVGKMFAIASDPLNDNVKGIYHDFTDKA